MGQSKEKKVMVRLFFSTEFVIKSAYILPILSFFAFHCLSPIYFTDMKTESLGG